MNRIYRRWLLAVLGALLTTGGLSSCVTTSPQTQAMLDARRAKIAAEPRGDYFIGRRYWIARTQLWGYIRRPGESWDVSKLVMINEQKQRRPDHDGISPFGYDNNFEYRIWGRFSGDTVYDPTSNLFLPEFVLERYELISANPGFLFHPEEKRSASALLRMP